MLTEFFTRLNQEPEDALLFLFFSAPLVIFFLLIIAFRVVASIRWLQLTLKCIAGGLGIAWLVGIFTALLLTVFHIDGVRIFLSLIVMCIGYIIFVFFHHHSIVRFINEIGKESQKKKKSKTV